MSVHVARDRTKEFFTLTRCTSARATLRSRTRELWNELEQHHNVADARRAQLVNALEHWLQRLAVVDARNDDERAHFALLWALARQKFTNHAPDTVAAADNEAESASVVDEDQWQAQRLQWIDEPAEQRAQKMQRSRALKSIERQLWMTSSVYSELARHVQSQNDQIGLVECRVDRLEQRLARTHDNLLDAAPRTLRTWRARWRHRLLPQTLAAKLRLCMCVAFACNTLALCWWTSTE